MYTVSAGMYDVTYCAHVHSQKMSQDLMLRATRWLLGIVGTSGRAAAPMFDYFVTSSHSIVQADLEIM